MRPVDLLLVLISVALSSLSQVVLKRGMTSPPVRAALEGGGIGDTLIALVTSPFVTGGLACFGMSAVVWLFVLSRIPLSLAYPFVALGIVATVFAGSTLFGESPTPQSLMGVALIVSGVVMVGLAK
ncbi:SMR family transporter [Ancylobacter mangrovi]|uniref:SMR family transporter n=1 Tax=Ancylobacter mangrovi TaxID=2972472 RepID=UPI002162CD55|nr:SMR family transporter [Ancylobacter mangrovi]MCS0502153.1 SMR family transporter [Ancylobacter mangrovi]